MTQRVFAVTGASGLVGRALTERWRARGDRVIEMVRRAARGPDELRWDPTAAEFDATPLEGMDGVVHLAGENVAAERWTAEFKERIRDSRVQGTRALVTALTRLEQAPRVLISASGVGYYGHRGDEWLEEDSAPGTGFMADVCQEWEAAARAFDARSRSVQLRIGMVLSHRGGALAKMLLPFRMGLGGRLGTGKQYVSYVGLDDLVRIVEHVLDDEALQGPVNATAPSPVPQREFARALGQAVGRPAFMPVPAFAVRAVFGELSDEVLTGQRVRPKRLADSGFEFRHSGVDEALRAALDG